MDSPSIPEMARAGIRHRQINFFTYGFYPISERWRVDGSSCCWFGVVWMAWLEARRRDLGVVYFFVVSCRSLR